MDDIQNMTHIEHYIPRFYLRHFSVDKTKVFRYDIEQLDLPPKLSLLTESCQEKDMYELFNEDNSYLAPNLIEKAFGRIETETGRVIKSIAEKSADMNNSDIDSLVSENEKNTLIIFLTTLLFRDPITINKGIKFQLNENSNLSEREARNYTLFNMLPLGVDKKWDQNTIGRMALRLFGGMSLKIGVSHEDLVITGDKPVVLFGFSRNKSDDRVQKVLFPLTSNLIMYLYSPEIIDGGFKNVFINVNNQQLFELHDYISMNAEKYLFSKKQLTEIQIERLKTARQRRNIELVI